MRKYTCIYGVNTVYFFHRLATTTANRGKAMLTKTKFFALLNDANNKIGVTAHVKSCENKSGMELFISQSGAPNTWLSSHKSSTTANAAFKKYNAWLNEWFAARAEEAQARIDVLDMEAAHAEALEMNEEIDNKRRGGEAMRTIYIAYEVSEEKMQQIQAAVDHEIAFNPYFNGAVINIERGDFTEFAGDTDLDETELYFKIRRIIEGDDDE